MNRLLATLALLLLTTGCPRAVDNITVNRVLEQGYPVPDLQKACYLGTSFAFALGAGGTKNHPPRKALVIANTTSGMCAELDARDDEMDEARARFDMSPEPVARASRIRDARVGLARSHTLAALRFDAAFQMLEAEYGVAGEETCPRIRKDDEVVYLFGLVAGMLAMMHDGAGGGHNDVPLDTLAKVSRAAKCVDNETWWYTPRSLELALWATIPGSGPKGLDPWAELEANAQKGDATGVRLARAVQVMVAANAGRMDIVLSGVEGHAQSIVDHPRLQEHALLDEYALQISVHQSDLIWMSAKGHRTEKFGTLPKEPEAVQETTGPDPFGGEPDPFGE